MPSPAVVGSALWWASRLHKQLRDRRRQVDRFDDYYRGRHPLPWLPEQVREIAQRFLRMTVTNYMGLVVDSQVERLEVLGFRIGDGQDADDAAWAMWQANALDAASPMAFTEAAKCGSSYLLVGPPAAGQQWARLTVEHAAQAIVEYEPGELRQRAAGLKVWLDDVSGMTFGTLYLPDEVYKFQGPRNSTPASWVERQPGVGGRLADEEWPLTNPLGVVPLIELPNNPQLLCGGISEIDDVTDIQDRINKTVADRMLSQDFGAFPQKWASGWELGDDEFDENGDPAPKPLELGRDRLVRATTDVKFGDFTVAPLDPFSNAKSEDVRDIAARTRTPPHYLLGSMINMSSEALQAAMDGLIAKVGARQKPYESALEEAVLLGLRLSGDERAAADTVAHTIWRDPSYRSIAQLTDAVIKQYASGLITRRVAQEKLGFAPALIDRMAAELAADRVAAATAQTAGLSSLIHVTPVREPL